MPNHATSQTVSLAKGFLHRFKPEDFTHGYTYIRLDTYNYATNNTKNCWKGTAS